MKKILFILFATALTLCAQTFTLHTVNTGGIHYKQAGKGGMYRASLPVELPADAFQSSWASDTLTLTYYTPNLPDAEGNATEPTQHTLILAQADLDAAIVEITTPKPPAVPERVTKRQIRIALIKLDLDVSAAIDAMPDGQDKEILRVEWDHADFIHRKHPMVDGLGASLGLTSAQVDDLFRAAALVPTSF